MPRDVATSVPDRASWALAYIKQGGSDFEIYRLLSSIPGVPICHLLHYLQMAGEKVAKAYRFRDTDTDEERLTTEHVAFSRFMQSYLGSPEIKQRYAGKDELLRETVKVARKLAREIEKLAPAVDREISPANAEYPWSDDGRVVVPCEFTYPNLTLLTEPGGRTFLRLLEMAIADFERIRIY
ncbi:MULTISPECIES: hypothetical protein [Sorangium]|uniref:hypothetical protein n=1 Tax=Sorangium TaxID=39643 RepID=UPI003D9A4E7A